MEYLWENKTKCTNCGNIIDYNKSIDIEKIGKYK